MDRMQKLKEYLENNRGDNFLTHALALEYIKAGHPEEARQLFEGLLQKDPEYTGSYYHLAKLLETMGEKESALEWYKKGMEAAVRQGDRHVLSELQAAYEELDDL